MLSFTSVFFIPRRAAAVVLEEFIYDAKEEQETHNAHDVEYTPEDDVENLH